MKTFAVTENPAATTARRVAPRRPLPAPRHEVAMQREQVRQILASAPIQCKSAATESEDPYELEADRLADHVLSMPEPALQAQTEPEEEEEEELQTAPLASSISPLIQRQAEEEEEEEEVLQAQVEEEEEEEELQAQPEEEEEELLQAQVEEEEEEEEVQAQAEEEEEEEEEILQTKRAAGAPSGGGRGIGPQIRTQRGGGSPVPDSARSFFEPRFGTSFSHVRLHRDAVASDLCTRVGARAFTSGRDIYFRRTAPDLASAPGRRLLAHELVHVVQQSPPAERARRGEALAGSVSAAPRGRAQAAPIVMGIAVPGELGVGRRITATAQLGPGATRRTRLDWSLGAGAPAGVTIARRGRTTATLRADNAAATLAAAGGVFQVECELEGTPADAAPPQNFTLVGIANVDFRADPPFNNVNTALGASVFPPDTADPNRDGIAGNTAIVDVTTAPVGRANTVTLRRALGATIAANTITPGTRTGNATVRVTEDATGSRRDETLVINPVPRFLQRFTAQNPSPTGIYGCLNSIQFASTDTTGVLSRAVGETITAGARDDFGYTAGINHPIGPNPNPRWELSAPGDNWHDNLFTGAGANAGAAGDANMINVNRYVGPGVADRLPRIWILRQGFHWRTWANIAAPWGNEIDHGIHRRSLRGRPGNFIFRTEHIFPRARARRFDEAYAGPDLIEFNTLAIAPVGAAQLAADGAATATATVVSTVAGRNVNWTVIRGDSAFTVPAAGVAAPAGNPATLQAGNRAGWHRVRVADSVFPNRRAERSVRLVRVRFRRMRAPRRVAAGTLTANVTLQAVPGGRTVDWEVDAAAVAAHVTIAANAVPDPAATERGATVTRPAVYSGSVTVTATDHVDGTVTATRTIRFQ